MTVFLEGCGERGRKGRKRKQQGVKKKEGGREGRAEGGREGKR